MNLRALLATGLALVLLGLLLGLIPGSVSDSFSCGSPWARDTTMTGAADRGVDLGAALAGRANTSTSYSQLCADKLDARGVWGGVLAGLGALTLIGAGVVNAQRESLNRGHQHQAHSEDA